METFGKYRLLERIGGGGMAEVWRAEVRYTPQVSKVVALKRIRADLAEVPQFVSLFIDEARITSRINHANVAQVLDFGEAEGAPFLAMELVDGPDLETLLLAAQETSEPLPLALCAHIMSEVAWGLSAAHTLTDDQGRPYGIVHRDVSPQNVLLSRTGDVKLTDFGIARARDKITRTEAGALMGKFRYMSPEQVQGEPLDARSDIFSAGVLLYELITGVRLFDARSSAEVVDQIRYMPIPPLAAHRPEVDPALETVVGSALERDRDRRCPDAATLARDLERYIHVAHPRFTRDELVAWVNRLVPQRSLRNSPLPYAGTELAAATRTTSPGRRPAGPGPLAPMPSPESGRPRSTREGIPVAGRPLVQGDSDAPEPSAAPSPLPESPDAANEQKRAGEQEPAGGQEPASSATDSQSAPREATRAYSGDSRPLAAARRSRETVRRSFDPAAPRDPALTTSPAFPSPASQDHAPVVPRAPEPSPDGPETAVSGQHDATRTLARRAVVSGSGPAPPPLSDLPTEALASREDITAPTRLAAEGAPLSPCKSTPAPAAERTARLRQLEETRTQAHPPGASGAGERGPARGRRLLPFVILVGSALAAAGGLYLWHRLNSGASPARLPVPTSLPDHLRAEPPARALGPRPDARTQEADESLAALRERVATLATALAALAPAERRRLLRRMGARLERAVVDARGGRRLGPPPATPATPQPSAEPHTGPGKGAAPRPRPTGGTVPELRHAPSGAPAPRRPRSPAAPVPSLRQMADLLARLVLRTGTVPAVLRTLLGPLPSPLPKKPCAAHRAAPGSALQVLAHPKQFAAQALHMLAQGCRRGWRPPLGRPDGLRYLWPHLIVARDAVDRLNVLDPSHPLSRALRRYMEARPAPRLGTLELRPAGVSVAIPKKSPMGSLTVRIQVRNLGDRSATLRPETFQLLGAFPAPRPAGLWEPERIQPIPPGERITLRVTFAVPRQLVAYGLVLAVPRPQAGAVWMRLRSEILP